MKGSRPYVFCGLLTGMLGIGLAYPPAITILSSIVLLVVLAQAGLQVAAAVRKKVAAVKPDVSADYQPFVSIHLVYATEPAQVVLRSLQRLSRLDYQNYEVVVLHNNTPDSEEVEKVRRYCQSNPHLFNFAHIDAVEGGKAGALELTRDMMAAHTELIAIVDSDYQVRPDFLRECTPYFADPQVALVQTPQDYSDAGLHNKGIALELRSFFSVAMTDAQTVGFVTFTGTMGILRAELFADRRLSWNRECITEDADLGTTINQLGYKGVYVDQSFGQGMLPLDYAGLRTQRQRWAYGNMQLLQCQLPKVLGAPRFSVLQRLSFVMQMTAWLRAEMLIAGIWIVTGVAQLIQPSEAAQFTYGFLAAALAVSVLSHAVYVVVGMGQTTRATFWRRWRAFLTQCGLISVMSMAWLRQIVGLPLHFKVTNKNADTKNAADRGYMPEALFPTLLSVGFMLQTIAGLATAPYLALVSGTIALVVAGVYYVHLQFMAAEAISPKKLVRRKVLPVIDSPLGLMSAREEDGLQR
jgi:cellulose synthase/poly-beta-1,6-N-acetylglucosamine synthase-like glycosyltransferase